MSDKAESSQGQPAKGDDELIESADVESFAPHNGAGKEEGLSQEHIEYLLERHGTLELDPIPLPTAADPYNWPSWKVCWQSPSQQVIN